MDSSSRHIIINTDGKEQTQQSRLGMGHWVTDNLLQLQQTLNLNSQGCCHMVPNQFQALDVMCVAFLVKQATFLNYKHTQANSSF